MHSVEQRLQEWARNLLDLSYRNPLLNMPNVAPSAKRQRTLQLQQPLSDLVYSMIVEGESAYVTSPPDMDKLRLPLDPVEDAESEPEDNVAESSAHQELPAGTVLSRQPEAIANRLLLRLMRQSRTWTAEQGVNVLFATFGVLSWKDSKKDDQRRAPLLLVPLQIEEDGRRQAFRIRRLDDSVEFNLTLQERIRQDFQFSIQPPAPMEGNEFGYHEVLNHVLAAIADRDDMEVLEEVHIGLFQSYKLRMIEDLNGHLDIATSHPIVQALATDGMQIATPPVSLPEFDELDTQVQPAETFSILDADSSQQRVIEAVKRGAHLVVEGPPGTGKSQTIANVIAEAIAQDKRVLFVSEKAAALDVVYRRLEQAKLGEFCFPLHSHKANKAEVIAELHERMESVGHSVAMEKDEHGLARLVSLRQQLNAYPEALHRRRDPLGQLVYRVLGWIAELENSLDQPGLPIPAVQGLTLDQLDEWAAAISDLVTHNRTLVLGTSHPWAMLGDTELSIAERDDLRGALSNLHLYLEKLSQKVPQLAELVGKDDTVSIADIRDVMGLLASVPVPDSIKPEWLLSGEAERLGQLLRDAQAKLPSLQVDDNHVLSSFDVNIYQLPHRELLETYERNVLLRQFLPQHRQNRATVQATMQSGSSLSERDEAAALRRAAELAPDWHWFQQHSDEVRTVTGFAGDSLLSANSHEWNTCVDNLAEIDQLARRFDGSRLPGALGEAIATGLGNAIRMQVEEVTDLLNRLDESVAALSKLLSQGSLLVSDRVWTSHAVGALQKWTLAQIDRFHEIDDWLQARAALRRVRELGLEPSATYLEVHETEPSGWAAAFRRRVLQRWVTEQLAADATLGAFSRESRDQDIRQFAELDKTLVSSAGMRLRKQMGGTHRGYRDSGEPGILRWEHAKKRRKLPPRILFQKIPNLLLELKPCLMMSPLSVAHFLPADRFSFDLVIFDEASQVRPHDAIGAIMRGEQLVVAGDSKQLPPTSFFDRGVETDGDASDEESLSDMESVLEALPPKGIKPLPLTWHYRSRHESLIAFSNYLIYGGKLQTFPTPSVDADTEHGVHFDFVANGRLERKRGEAGKTQNANPEEVAEVLKVISAHAREFPDRSMGVVALNVWHKEAVEDGLRRQAQIDHVLEEWLNRESDEPLFVKNLEEVQGDERDVMIVTIGFAKAENDRLNHNFGPISQAVGRRRINVLVTRARQKLIVVSSIRSDDIEESRVSTSGGTWLLKKYLEYAEKGPAVLESMGSSSYSEAESEFEREVAQAVNALGYVPHLQVGVSGYRIDIGVVDPSRPGRYLVGIECDGATYHSSKTARDRDRLRQEVLEGIGWSIYRIWSTEWFRNREREVAHLEDALRRAQATQKPANVELSTPGTPVSAAQAEAVLVEIDKDELNPEVHKEPRHVVEGDPTAELYQVAQIDRGGAFPELHQAPPEQLRRAIWQCVDVEGPIHVDLLVKRLASAWGHDRAGTRIRSRVDADLATMVSQGDLSQSGNFLSITGKEVEQARGLDSDGKPRKIDFVASEELQVAIVYLLRRSLSLERNELMIETARYMGYNRTGKAIRNRLNQEIQNAIAAGRVKVSNGRCELAK